MSVMECVKVVGVTPFEQPNADLVIALLRAGAFGFLDLGRDPVRFEQSLARVACRSDKPFGVRVPLAPYRENVSALETLGLPEQVTTVLLASPVQLTDAPLCRALGLESGQRSAWVEVTSLAEAEIALAAGAQALVAKGAESGGRVGDSTCFVLLQQLVASTVRPVYAQGGIGLHTAAAAIAGGAAGVVLDAQLACVQEAAAGLPSEIRTAVGAMDGSETVLLGGHRVYTRPDLPVSRETEVSSERAARRLGGMDLRHDWLPVGQEGAFARPLADRFVTAGGVVVALRSQVEASLASARRLDPLRPGSPFAMAHGLAYPIAQGPMTRVSDRADFAEAVGEAGGLPFLALALMKGPEVRQLLDETVARLGDRAWGVGILGFVPAEVRDAQLEEVRRVRPPFALIAGGRPSQARTLEQDGIPTYLHVPSSGLLRSFLKDGARRFVFEGRECGGHVGPRSSFALWEAQIQELLRHGDLSDVFVLFAGGIHDARSAAMVAALSGAIVERGARVGVLMGSAYILTHEAVACGAVQPLFQQEVCAADHTVLLETSPGHAIRVLDSPYIEQFYACKREMAAAGSGVHEIWAALEDLNLGRLRIASKGVRRDGDRLCEVDRDVQLRDGMFMIGQVATMRSSSLSIAALHECVSAEGSAFLRDDTPQTEPETHAQPLDIAIVGIAGCFPDAEDVDAFWANVVYGRDAIREVPEERWNIQDYYDPDATGKRAGSKSLSKWGGFLPEIPFDALAYGIPPRSLASIDPVQLLSLEMARRALSDAGYAEREFDRSRTAVIFGAESGTDLMGAYGLRALFPQFLGELPEELDAHIPSLTEDSFPGVLTNVIAGRIANRLDLGGANFTVDAACATSMAALDQSCKELRSGSCDMVLCGAADLHNGINDYLLFSSVHALSPRGRCHTFDRDADGISLGEGIACVVLKRLEDAERDGDRIYAVLRGSGASSDGRCMGLTAPRPEGQRLALARAYAQSGVSPADVGLVEAHGTGTVVGDRTELVALTELYRDSGATPSSCTLGSVKSQIGHTKCAAGLAGLIKATFSLYTGVRTPTANLKQPNPYYDAQTSPFHFSDVTRPWLSEQRHAAVSAFGFGGSNFHAVLSAYTGADSPKRGLRVWPVELVLLRANETEGLNRELAHVTSLLDANDRAGRPWQLRDVAYTMASRSEETVRAAIVASSLDELRARISELHAGEPTRGVYVHSEERGLGPGQVAFVYPGQGSQRVGMLSDLYAAFPHLRELLALGAEYVDRIFPPTAFSQEERGQQQRAVTDTRVAQPALGIADLSVHRLLSEFGVVPDVVAGHSYGELVALCAAGSFDERDLLMLSEARAHAILEAAGDDPGSMAAVQAPAGEVERALEGLADIVLANDNAPRQIVISGSQSAIEQALVRLSEAGIAARRIPVACAFHSPIVAGAAETLAKRLAEISLQSPTIPVWSNSTGRTYPSDPDALSELLAQQVARPVRFREQIENMYQSGARVFIEAGPGRVLSGLVGKILHDRPHVSIPCDVPGESSLESFLNALGELATLGLRISVSALFRERGARRIDEATIAKTRPHYRINGYTVREATGSVVEGALMPVTTIPPVNLAARTASSDERDTAVQTYLRGMRELVAAQRDVMLGYLGASASPATMIDLAPIAPARPAELSSEARTRSVETPPSDSGQSLAASTPEPAAPLRGEALMQAVLEIVSERTGYPTEMLEPDLDLEADLSIDSIKRMEILAELAERIDLPGGDGGELDESVVEELARLKTLREVVDWIDSSSDARTDADEASAEAQQPAERGPDAKEHAVHDAVAAALSSEASSDVPERTRRYRYECVPLDHDSIEAAAPIPPDALEGRTVRILGGPTDLHKQLERQIEASGGRIASKRPGTPPVQGEIWLHLGPLSQDPNTGIARLFAELQQRAVPCISQLLVATGLGGRLGIESPLPVREDNVHAAAGVRGLLRTFAREFPEIHTRAVDVDPSQAPDSIAEILVRELVATDGFVDVGYVDGVRHTLQLAAEELDPAQRHQLELDRESVLLVTGGARGIGARSALALARASGCHIELVGRTPLPTAPEPGVYADAPDAQSLRRAIIDHTGLRKPAEVEALTTRILAEREIRANLAALEQVASSVTYHATDVSDASAFVKTLREIYRRRERIDGVVHAAGILEDKLIRDKTPDSFRRVFDTKASSFKHLMQELAPGVRFVVSFGSVAGAFGNRGQVDYAAANEALALYSRLLAAKLGARVVTLAWGPWGGGGMVTPELEREYARRGIGLIDPEDGVRCLVDELRFGSTDAIEVILMRSEPAEWTVPTTRDDLAAAAPTNAKGAARGDAR